MSPEVGVECKWGLEEGNILNNMVVIKILTSKREIG